MKAKKTVKVYETKQQKKDKNGREYKEHLVRIRANVDTESASYPAGTEVIVSGTISKTSTTPNLVGHLDYKGKVKAIELYLLEKNVTVKPEDDEK